MGRNVFLSYATGSFVKKGGSLCKSALDVGFDQAILSTDDDIRHTPFWNDNQEILMQSRGAGYWLWKPFIILQQLKKMNKEDVLVYCDAGRSKYYEFDTLPVNLLHKTRLLKNGFLLGPALYQHGSLLKWVKRDCLLLMNSDTPSLHDKPIIQATWSFWTPTAEAFDFLEKWLSYSCDPRCLTDLENTLGFPNYPQFIDHRHDQSILTLLAYQKGINYLDYSDTYLFRILGLRPQSILSHLFLKRIDDCEQMEGNTFIIKSLFKSYRELTLDRYKG